MSQVVKFRTLVRRTTTGRADQALRFGQYLVMMGYTAQNWGSVRAQLTRAMRRGGSLADLVDEGLVRPDEANRQPGCFRDRAIARSPGRR